MGKKLFMQQPSYNKYKRYSEEQQPIPNEKIKRTVKWGYLVLRGLFGTVWKNWHC